MPGSLLSRQPACGHCGHEEHLTVCECSCPAHAPTGIYLEET